GEVGEGADAGPHVRMKLRAVRRLAEKILRASLLIREIVFVQLDAGINDDHGAKTFGAQVAQHFLRIGKTALVPSEDAKAVHVVYVEVEDITRDVARA